MAKLDWNKVNQENLIRRRQEEYDEQNYKIHDTAEKLNSTKQQKASSNSIVQRDNTIESVSVGIMRCNKHRIMSCGLCFQPISNQQKNKSHKYSFPLRNNKLNNIGTDRTGISTQLWERCKHCRVNFLSRNKKRHLKRCPKIIRVNG